MAEAAGLPERVDVAVVGAGPAGIAAAVTATRLGARVCVVDAAPRPGGQIWRHRDLAGLSGTARAWLGRLEASGAVVACGTAVLDVERPGLRLRCEGPAGATVLCAGRLVIATGARERFLPFPGWTLPGVMGVGGAQALLKSGAPFNGLRVLVAGTGPLLLPAAAALARAGADIALVAEQAPLGAVLRFGLELWRSPGKVLEAGAYRFGFRGAAFRTGIWVVEARGDGALREVVVTDGRRRWTEPCDVLASGFGLVPEARLARLLGCPCDALGRVIVDEAQRTRVTGVYCAGEPTGIGGVNAALAEGEVAGAAAAGRPGSALRAARRARRLRRFAGALERAFEPREELRHLPRADTIVCRCEDVTCGSVAAAGSAREAKLFTRAGMGPCQGRVCGPALRWLHGWSPDAVRPPVAPARVASLLASSSEP